MEQEKQIFNLAPGMSEVIIRQGQAPKVLDPKAPLQYDVVGQLNCVAEFLAKRVGAGQFTQENCTIFVRREKSIIHLAFNERCEYERGDVSGVMKESEDFADLHINDECFRWTPMMLAKFFKMHRYLFADKQECMKIVTTLMHYTADIQQKVSQSAEANGNRDDAFSQVVNSNLPGAVKLSMPIFVGGAKESIEVELFADVDGREVRFLLISPAAVEVKKETTDKAIDEQLAIIKEIAPNIAIIEQ